MHYRGRASVLHEFSSRIEHCTRGVVAINFALNATPSPEDGGSRELLENRKTASPPTIFHSSKKEASFIFSVSSRVFLYFHALLPLLLNLIIVETSRLAKGLIDCIIAIIIVQYQLHILWIYRW